MSYMFTYCMVLTSLDISHFNTKKLENMDHMFSYCYKIEKLDFPNFETSNVENMGHYFFVVIH